MPLVPVDDPNDERLVEYTQLTDAQLMRRSGTFLCESEFVIRRAIELGVELRSMLVTPSRLERLRDAIPPGTVVYVAEQEVMNAVAGFSIHRGGLAAAERPAPRRPEEILEHARTVAVLEGINDVENLGAIFRNAAAFGIDAVLLDPTTADPLYRRVVRVSMGHVLAVPWARIDDPTDIDGFTTVALTPDRDADTIDTIHDIERVALLLGAEGPGLAADTKRKADRRVRIPTVDDVDSLNVATAAAIAFHHRHT